MNFSKTATSFRILCLGLLLVFCGALHSQPTGGKWTAVGKLPILTNGHLLFADSLTGYYIGKDTGYVTTDGAKTWTQMTFSNGAVPAPYYLFAPNRDLIASYQLSAPGIIASSNHGTSWAVVPADPVPTSIKELTMWSAIDGHRIWRDDISNKVMSEVTHDGGRTFPETRSDTTLQKYINKLTKPTKVDITSAWSDSLHGVIAVHTITSKIPYPALMTSDGGRSWTEQYLKYKGDSSIRLGETTVYPGSGSIWIKPLIVLEARYAYYSSDYGASWQTTDTANGQSSIYKLAPVSPTATWAIMVTNNRNPELTQNVIAYKEFSGKWVNVVRTDTLAGVYHLLDIQFADKYHGWATGQTFPQSADLHIFRYTAPITSAVNENTENTTLRCLPNPASSVVKIEGLRSDEHLRDVIITNALGIRFSSAIRSATTVMEFSVSDLPVGCYFVRIVSSLRTETIPVMVVR